MNRRTFTKTLGLSIAAVGLNGVPALASKQQPQFSITMDDFQWNNPVKLTAVERNEAILNALSSRSRKAALFVIGRNIDSAEGKQLLASWDQAGHMIGNHSYSHRNFNAPTTNIQEYQDDILKAEALLKEFPRFRKYFRFPI